MEERFQRTGLLIGDAGRPGCGQYVESEPADHCPGIYGGPDEDPGDERADGRN